LNIVKTWEIKGYKVKPPYERILKVLISPLTHKEVKGLAIGMVIIPPGSKSNKHKHEKSEEYWIIVDGRGEIEINGEKAKLEPGIIVHAPPGATHQLFNTGEEPLKAYYIFVPPGPEEETLRKMKSKNKNEQ